MHRNISWLCAAALCVTFLGGCNKSESGASTSNSAGGKIKLCFVTNNSADFWTVARAGCNQAMVENPNIDVQFRICDDGQAATQKRIVDDQLADGVQGIAISPCDPTNETPDLNADAAKAVVFCTDSDAPDSNRACYIGTKNEDAGRQAGDLIKQAIPNGGKIMMFVGNVDAQNAKDRINGIKEALAGSNVTILDIRTDDAHSDRAKSNAQDALVNNPDIACLVGLYSYDGPAIVNAVKEANKVGQVKIVCFDTDDETLAGVKDGSIYATVVQQPFEFGRLSMLDLAKFISGDKTFVPSSKEIYIPTLAIKKDNIDQFTATLNKQLGK